MGKPRKAKMEEKVQRMLRHLFFDHENEFRRTGNPAHALYAYVYYAKNDSLSILPDWVNEWLSNGILKYFDSIVNDDVYIDLESCLGLPKGNRGQSPKKLIQAFENGFLHKVIMSEACLIRAIDPSIKVNEAISMARDAVENNNNNPRLGNRPITVAVSNATLRNKYFKDEWNQREATILDDSFGGSREYRITRAELIYGIDSKHVEPKQVQDPITKLLTSKWTKD